LQLIDHAWQIDSKDTSGVETSQHNLPAQTDKRYEELKAEFAEKVTTQITFVKIDKIG
jgi:hypothetical protein